MNKIYNRVFAEKPILRNRITRLLSQGGFQLEYILSRISVTLCKWLFNLDVNHHLFVSNRVKKQANNSKHVDKSHVIFPLDSVRYFEFAYSTNFIKQSVYDHYLDISSPRFFYGYLLENFTFESAHLINPDIKDAAITNELFQSLEIGNGTQVRGCYLSDLNLPKDSKDLITCISVLEHIESNDTLLTVLDEIFDVAKPGGTLIVSFPIAQTSFAEYIDYNEYDLQQESGDGFYFGQRFFDETMIRTYFFNKFGAPVNQALLAEKESGYFFQNRFQKINNPNYRFWLEPYYYCKNYKVVSNFSELKGIGVAVFQFKISK